MGTKKVNAIALCFAIAGPNSIGKPIAGRQSPEESRSQGGNPHRKADRREAIPRGKPIAGRQSPEESPLTTTPEDAVRTVDQALQKAKIKVNARPRLLSDNGSCYLSGELKSYLSKRGLEHTRGKPMHPQTQGKIKRYHRTMKNRILLEHYYSPEELERALGEFIDFYNNNRLHESLNNLAPADVYFNRGEKILKQREEIKQKTILQRRINHLLQIQNQSLSFV